MWTVPAYSWTRSLNMACSEGWPSSGTKSASTKCSGQTLAKVIQHYSIININSTNTTLLYNQWQVATATVASKQRTASLLSYFKYTDRGACPNTPHSKELLLVGYLHPHLMVPLDRTSPNGISIGLSVFLPSSRSWPTYRQITLLRPQQQVAFSCYACDAAYVLI